MEILQKDNPILREVANPIETNLYLDELITQMVEAMRKADGIGLAAPQVGHSIRLFIITDIIDEDEKKAKIKVFVNPEIVSSSEETCEFVEGCLSIEGVTGVVTRPEKVTVKYQDIYLNEFTEEFDGYKARVIQHEYDHLNGVLFTDYLD